MISKISQLQSALSLLALCVAVRSQDCRTSYEPVIGSLCINDQFTEVLGIAATEGAGPTLELQCSVQCSSRQRCQAFSTADGPCKLFVFDRCSKGVKNCTCSRTGRVFVKRLAGLQAGRLCPSGYDTEHCGVRYKVHPNVGNNWWTAKQSCENESGLVIMADVADSAEMSFIDTQFNRDYFNKSKSIWLGGFKYVASAVLTDGWFWVGCNISVHTSLWGARQPDNTDSTETAINRFSGLPGLNDFSPSLADGQPEFGLCECVSPFN